VVVPAVVVIVVVAMMRTGGLPCWIGGTTLVSEVMGKTSADGIGGSGGGDDSGASVVWINDNFFCGQGSGNRDK